MYRRAQKRAGELAAAAAADSIRLRRQVAKDRLAAEPPAGALGASLVRVRLPSSANFQRRCVPSHSETLDQPFCLMGVFHAATVPSHTASSPATGLSHP